MAKETLINILLKEWGRITERKKSLDAQIKSIKEQVETIMERDGVSSLTKKLEDGTKWMITRKTSQLETVTKEGKAFLKEYIGRSDVDESVFFKRTVSSSTTIREVK